MEFATDVVGDDVVQQTAGRLPVLYHVNFCVFFIPNHDEREQ
jgi:hypothetical protein